MLTKIQRWGHSLGLRIPQAFARQARVGEGSDVDLAVERGRLVIRPVRSDRYSLKRLLSRIRRSNLHGEVDAGGPVGRERW